MKSRKILMTGACSGFGASVYDHLTARGHEVTGMGLQGPDIFCNFHNFRREPAELHDLVVSHAEKESYDVLINNAGDIDLGSTTTSSMYKFDDIVFVNLIVPYYIIRAFLKAVSIAPNGDGEKRIINTGSMSTFSASRCCPGYVASKAGLEAMNRALARELTVNGLVFATIAPALVGNTGMQQRGLIHLINDRGMTSLEAEKYQTANPMNRRITHEEICKVYQFAVEEMPAAMSGTTLKIPMAAGM